MKYILLLNLPQTAYESSVAWSKKDIDANVAFMVDFKRDLSDSGEFVAADSLTPPAQAKVVWAGKDGVPVTDGVFPESKEFLAGYLVVDVESPERADEIAARWSEVPGPGGVPTNALIEVRPIGSRKPFEPV